MHTIDKIHNRLYNQMYNRLYFGGTVMKNNLFGEKVSYEHFAPPYVLIALMSRFVNRYQSAANAVFKELSWQQMFFLNGVTLFKEAPSIKDMADFLGCTHQNANKLYAKLLRDGYIVSQQDGDDRRKQRIYLTDKALRFLSDKKVGSSKSVQDIFSVVSDAEMEMLIDAMAKLTDSLGEKRM